MTVPTFKIHELFRLTGYGNESMLNEKSLDYKYFIEYYNVSGINILYNNQAYFSGMVEENCTHHMLQVDLWILSVGLQNLLIIN